MKEPQLLTRPQLFSSPTSTATQHHALTADQHNRRNDAQFNVSCEAIPSRPYRPPPEMPAAASAGYPPSSLKMDGGRKHSLVSDEYAPPNKRQAVNGNRSNANEDLPWKDDLEAYQKEAIYRQMQEYKREKNTLESQLKDVKSRSTYHDDHLRVVDSWWSQLLDEVRLLSEDELPEHNDDISYSTAITFRGSEDFTEHLAAKSKEIKAKLSTIFADVIAARGLSSPDVQDLQSKLAKMLASQKEYLAKVDRLRVEKEELSERLETASLRYIKAEKRLDRAKSSSVAKMEQQAIAGIGNSAGSGIGGVETGADIEMANGIEEENVTTQTAVKEASAIVAKQKDQLEAINLENKSMVEQLTAATARLSNLTEDDYARTELFKQLRGQHEEVIKRINHLEQTNKELQEELKKYQTERTAYRTKLENEKELATSELESHLQRVESDITRIRSARDELAAEVSMRKATMDQDSTASDQLKELLGAKDDRIVSLELEVERLRARVEEQAREPSPEIDSMDLEQLKSKYEALSREFESINKELPALQGAYKRVQALSNKKVMDFASLEERVSQFSAEKTKADQKYFGARKDMDMRIGEVRSLRAQNAKSSEIISQLKDVETSNRNLLSNLEKQLSDMKQSNISIAAEHKKLEASTREAVGKTETLKHHVIELTNMLKLKDNSNSNAKQRVQSVETELEQLRVRYEQTQKERDNWKTKSLSNQSGEEEMLRALALCTICRKDFKNTVLKTCGHIFCNNCVDDRITNRMRKCPNCAKSFDKMDVMAVHM